MSTTTVPITFESVWEEFIDKVRLYNSQQRKGILQQTIHAFNGILGSLPAPRQEGVTSELPPTASGKRMLGDVETLIYDRMHQLGHDKQLFLRYDHAASGVISEQQFRACIASLGISLTDEEMNALVQKYDSDGLGSINYADFWKYLQAAAEYPRSTHQSAYSTALLNRTPQAGGEAAALARQIPETLEERIARGLKIMRECMYQKSSNFYGTFVSLQNPQKQIAIPELIPQLQKLGFPPNLVSEEDLTKLANKYSIQNPGFFTYAEFLAFFTGHDPSKDVLPKDGGVLDSPALMNCLVKINNLNLRKFFKDLDQDQDGLISTDQLMQGLIEQGNLHESITADKPFRTYLETFTVRKPGYFGYAEFIKFINARVLAGSGFINGQPISGHHTIVKIADDLNPSQILELIIKTLRSTAVSVESMFLQFDCNLDGQLDEAEFFQGISALGFAITAAQSKQFFDAVDVNHNGFIDIAEFASLIVNPNRNPKLSTRVRHAPGGASTVPMGSYSAGEPEPQRPTTARVASQPQSQFVLSAQETPLTEQEAKVYQKSHYGQGVAHRGQGSQSAVDLTHNESGSTNGTAGAPLDSPRSQSRGNPTGNPPGGRSSIDFANDHGATTPKPSSGPHVNQQSDAQLLNFDPSHPVQFIRTRPVPLQAQDHLQFSDELPAITTPLRTIVRPMHSPGGESSVSFNQADSEIPRSSRRILVAPGGTNFQLKFDEIPVNTEPVAPTYRPQDETSIDLSFDPNAETDEVRRLRRAGLHTPTPIINLAHSSSRVDADLDEPNGLTHKTRRYIEGTPSAVALGSPDGATLLSSYKAEPVEIDPAVIQALSTAIYAHSQRLRHTFQEWGKSSQSSTLSKANFVAGARALKVDLSDEQADSIFARFDADGDGAITYSEFVRILTTK